jgi:ATP-binding cassette subfamily G (WHITE) protein 2 (PDR)
MTIAAMPDAQTAASIVTLLSLLSTVFSGVLQTPSALPGFWIFMYRLSPFTYWISGIVSTELHGRQLKCSPSAASIFDPPSGMTCQEYLAPFLAKAPGQLENPNATSQCQYCTLSDADQYLAGSDIYWVDRWRNYGIMWAYIGFNIFMAVFLYYMFRVRAWKKPTLNMRLPWKKD